MARRASLVVRFRAAVAAFDPPLTDVVVAVSGGPDSVALLRAFVKLAAGRVVAAHLDHNWRGDEGHADCLFVHDLAAKLGIQAVSRLAEPDDYAAGNREAAARSLRYEWLTEIARAEGIASVATGHTADDQAETMLFRLFRGSGVGGLTGIAPRRNIGPGVEVVRPLLAVARADVLTYLATLKQDFRTDTTNADPRFTRNRIRHDLLPRLAQEYNPRVAENLARLADQARACQVQEDQALAALLRAVERPRAGGLCVFDRAALALIERSKLRSLWRHVWRREGWPQDDIGSREYDAVAGLCRGDATAHDLPGAIRVRAVAAVIQAGPIRAFEERA